MSISTQTEQLKAIGTRLSEERQKKSISLEEIAAKTYIPLRLLGAIEAGRLDQLPEPVFIQGFIRRFADAIGLDGSAISKEFIVTPAPAPIVVPTPAAAVTPQRVAALRPPKVSVPEPSTPAPKRRLTIDPASLRLPLIALGAAIGLGAIGAIAAVVAHRPAATPTAVSTSKPAEAPKAAAPAPKPAASQPSAVAVKMNVTDESWVEVSVDGQSVYEGTLTKGTVRSWNGKKQVVVNTGNAGGVSLSYNNSPLKSMGALGELQTATFPPNR